MRAILIVMSCLGAGALATAAAQTATPVAPAPSATAAPTSAVAPAATPPAAPATPAAPAAAASAASANQGPTVWEKELMAKGYKPAMYGNQKMYCHQEDTLGSRLGGHKVCATADQLALDQHNAKELTERTQKMPNNSGQ